MKIAITILITVLLVIPVVWFIVGTYQNATYKNVVEYKLLEVSDGVYGYYNTVTSRVPSHNHEVITLCLNGSVCTLKGDVNIHYTTGDPKVVWTQTKYVNGDTIDVYIPQGAIEMRPNVGIG